MSRKTDAKKRENMRKSWHEKEMSKEPDVNWRRCEKKELTRERDVTRKSADEKDLTKKAMSKSKRFQQKGKSCDRDVKKFFLSHAGGLAHHGHIFSRFASPRLRRETGGWAGAEVSESSWNIVRTPAVPRGVQVLSPKNVPSSGTIRAVRPTRPRKRCLQDGHVSNGLTWVKTIKKWNWSNGAVVSHELFSFLGIWKSGIIIPTCHVSRDVMMMINQRYPVFRSMEKRYRRKCVEKCWKMIAPYMFKIHGKISHVLSWLFGRIQSLLVKAPRCRLAFPLWLVKPLDVQIPFLHDYTPKFWWLNPTVSSSNELPFGG